MIQFSLWFTQTNTFQPYTSYAQHPPWSQVRCELKKSNHILATKKTHQGWFYLLPTPEAGKNSCHSVFEFWRLCGIHLPFLSHVVFRIVLASKSYLAIFIGMDWYGTMTLLDFPQQPIREKLGELFRVQKQLFCMWQGDQRICQAFYGFSRWILAELWIVGGHLPFWGWKRLLVPVAPPFLPIRHDPSVRQVFGWRNGYIMVTSCRLGIATGRRYTKIKDQGVQNPHSLAQDVFFEVTLYLVTSSSRASRWRKFQKKKELYSKERICL